MSGALVLIGLSGSGKSTVGKAAAEILGVPYLDTDRMVEERSGTAVSRLFESLGEAAFRKLESETLLLACNQRAVVATGGGAVLSSENRSAMRAGNCVVWLDPSLAVLAHRLAGHANNEVRPLLAGDLGNRLADLDRLRRPLYAESSQFRLTGNDVEVGNPKKTAVLVVTLYRRWYEAGNAGCTGRERDTA